MKVPLRIRWWIYDHFMYPFKSLYYRRKKIYECINCGKLAAPHYQNERHYVLTDDWGWKRLPNGHYVCHTCNSHPNLGSDPNVINTQNELLKLLIRNTDKRFYRKAFGNE